MFAFPHEIEEGIIPFGGLYYDTYVTDDDGWSHCPMVMTNYNSVPCLKVDCCNCNALPFEVDSEDIE